MSSLSFHFLYSALNSYSDLSVERCYLPGRETLELAVTKYIPSFESATPLTNFDILAFSVSYEIDFINILRILKLARIPLRSSERKDSGFPLVVVGGAACFQNILPLSETVDIFCVGEGEKTIPELVGSYIGNSSRGAGASGAAALTIADLQTKDNFICGERLLDMRSESVVRCAVSSAPRFARSAILTSDTEFSNMALIEIQRGCLRRCRFCMVGNCYGNFRAMPGEEVMKTAAEFLPYTKKFGLMGPAVSAHPQIESIQNFFASNGCDVSMSSVYVDELPDSTLRMLSSGASRNATFGIETPDGDIRSRLGKRLSNQSVLSHVTRASASGMRSLKLYFILGLYDYYGRDGNEEAGDTSRFIEECLDAACAGCRETKLKISVNPLIIKPRTPFFEQSGSWLPDFASLYSDPEYVGIMQERYKTILSAFRQSRNVEFSEKSFDEAVLMKIINECRIPLFDFFDDLFYNQNCNLRRVLKIMESPKTRPSVRAEKKLPSLEFYYE